MAVGAGGLVSEERGMKSGVNTGILAALTMMMAGQVPHAAHGNNRVRGDLLPQLMTGLRLKHPRAERYPGQHTAHLVGAWRGDGSTSQPTRQGRREFERANRKAMERARR